MIVGVFAAALNALPVLLVIFALVVMVMVHELGHFTAAKLSKMKVTEYFLGFGPRLWSVRRGETEYGVKAIPAGGYVRIVGMTTAEEIDPVDEPRSYRQSTFPRRFFVGVAGSAMHFVMAFLLCFAPARLLRACRRRSLATVGCASQLRECAPHRRRRPG